MFGNSNRTTQLMASSIWPPGIANAGIGAGPPTPTGPDAYAHALEMHIRTHGMCSFAELGSAVRRPPGITKLKKFLESRKEFRVLVDDMVSLSQPCAGMPTRPFGPMWRNWESFGQNESSTTSKERQKDSLEDATPAPEGKKLPPFITLGDVNELCTIVGSNDPRMGINGNAPVDWQPGPAERAIVKRFVNAHLTNELGSFLEEESRRPAPLPNASEAPESLSGISGAPDQPQASAPHDAQSAPESVSGIPRDPVRDPPASSQHPPLTAPETVPLNTGNVDRQPQPPHLLHQSGASETVPLTTGNLDRPRHDTSVPSPNAADSAGNAGCTTAQPAPLGKTPSLPSPSVAPLGKTPLPSPSVAQPSAGDCRCTTQQLAPLGGTPLPSPSAAQRPAGSGDSRRQHLAALLGGFVSPVDRNPKQRQYLDALRSIHPPVVMAVGGAGTGKTQLACAVGLEKLLLGQVQRMVITCPVVGVDDTVRELPGPQSRLEAWCRPIFEALHKHASSEAIDSLMREGMLEVVPLGYMQGRTFDNTWIVADDMQNSNIDTMYMLLSRFGQGSKLILAGDPVNYLSEDADTNGLSDLKSRLNNKPSGDVKVIEFFRGETQRHAALPDLLRRYDDVLE